MSKKIGEIMTTKIRGWIDRDTLSMFVEAQEYSEMSTMHIYTFPELKDDICIELTIVDPSVLEREADEAIKAIDEEMKK